VDKARVGSLGHHDEVAGRIVVCSSASLVWRHVATPLCRQCFQHAAAIVRMGDLATATELSFRSSAPVAPLQLDCISIRLKRRVDSPGVRVSIKVNTSCKAIYQATANTAYSSFLAEHSCAQRSGRAVPRQTDADFLAFACMVEARATWQQLAYLSS
jgi:hypothetical protein